MSIVHVLPSGGTVELLDVSELRAKHKRAVQRILSVTDPAQKIKSGVDATDEVIRVVTVNPPFSEEWLDNLSLADLDAIDKLVVPHAEAMFPPAVEPPANDEETSVQDTPTVPVSE